MDYYQIWLIAAIILVIIELLTAGFGVICFAIGALFSALVVFGEKQSRMRSRRGACASA